MSTVASRALRTVGALALTLAAASPTLAFNPQPDSPGLCSPCRSGPPAPHNPPTY
jgi:hypothetical protein